MSRRKSVRRRRDRAESKVSPTLSGDTMTVIEVHVGTSYDTFQRWKSKGKKFYNILRYILSYGDQSTMEIYFINLFRLFPSGF